MFVKNSGHHPFGAGRGHPDDPGALVLKISAYDEAFAEVLGKVFLLVGLVVDEGTHADGNE